MTKLRTGSPSLAYMGVEASTPPQQVTFDRLPTANDYTGYDLGTLWLAVISDVSQFVYMMTHKGNHVATWLLLNGGGGIGTITQVDGGLNINTVDPLGPIVTVNLDLSIHQPITSVGGDEGVYYLGAVGGVGGNTFLHGRGTQNTFVGQSSGNLGLTTPNAVRNAGYGYQVLTQNIEGADNSGFGQSCLAVLADGDFNTAGGSGSLALVENVDNNTSYGANSLSQLLTGDGNIALGYRAGFNYTSNEELNLVIGNEGTVGEDRTIRIGNDTDHTDTYISACWGNIVGGLSEIMIVDSVGKIGSTKGDNGEILIGATAGPPQWSQLSPGPGIAIANGINSITITNTGGGGGGGAATFVTDVNSPASIGATTSIDIFGDGIIETDGGGGSNTVTVSLTNGANGEVLIGGGAGPLWKTLTPGAGINVVNGPNSITISAPGAGGGSTTFNTDLLGPAIVDTGEIDILGGLNINTSGAGKVVTINLDTSIALPDANAAGDEGVYYLGGNNFMHNFGVAGTSYNTFLGEEAGNLTHASSVDSTGIGYQSLTSLTTGVANSALGSGSGKDLNTGSGNTIAGIDSLYLGTSAAVNSILGFLSFNGIVSGSHNLGLGYLSGSNCTGSDSSNIMLLNTGVTGDNNTIRIGTHGTGDGQQNKAYMAGIYGIAPGATNGVVLIDSNHKLGSENGANGEVLIGGGTGSAWAALTAGPGIDITNNPNSITITNISGGGTVTSVAGGTNINTTGTATDPIVNLNPSVTLTGSLTAGTGVTSTAGNITAAVGNIIATGGDITALGGDIRTQGATFSDLGRGVVQSSATGVLSSSEGTNGQVLISSSTAAPVWSTLTGGTNVTIDNTVGGNITINSTAGGGQIINWNDIHGIAQTLSPNQGYLIRSNFSGGGVWYLDLPSTGVSVGDMIYVNSVNVFGSTATYWRIRGTIYNNHGLIVAVTPIYGGVYRETAGVTLVCTGVGPSSTSWIVQSAHWTNVDHF